MHIKWSLISNRFKTKYQTFQIKTQTFQIKTMPSIKKAHNFHPSKQLKDKCKPQNLTFHVSQNPSHRKNHQNQPNKPQRHRHESPRRHCRRSVNPNPRNPHKAPPFRLKRPASGSESETESADGRFQRDQEWGDSRGLSALHFFVSLLFFEFVIWRVKSLKKKKKNFQKKKFTL